MFQVATAHCNAPLIVFFGASWQIKGVTEFCRLFSKGWSIVQRPCSVQMHRACPSALSQAAGAPAAAPQANPQLSILHKPDLQVESIVMLHFVLKIIQQ